MRWDDLFDDLAAQGRAADAAELAAEVDDRSRWEAGQIRLLDHLLVAVGRTARVLLDDGCTVEGPIAAAGDGWLLVDATTGRSLVPIHAVDRLAFVAGGSSAPAVAPAPPFEGAALRHVVRWLARDRAYVNVWLRGGRQLGGTVDRAGADHLELAEHDPDIPRRRDEVREVSLVPYAALVRVVRGRP